MADRSQEYIDALRLVLDRYEAGDTSRDPESDRAVTVLRDGLPRRAGDELTRRSAPTQWDMAERLAETERLRQAITEALSELDAEHVPQWSSDEMKAKGKDPIGCQICWPGDGSWPCVTRMTADDLRDALDEQPYAV